MRILVIEDEPRILAFVSRGLEAEGFTVDAAGDGPRRVSAVRCSRHYDLVVLDLLLAAARRPQRPARAPAATGPELPVVIVSARADLETKLRGFGLGACDYVSKPFSLDELLARIRAQLRRGHWGGDGNVALGRRADARPRAAAGAARRGASPSSPTASSGSCTTSCGTRAKSSAASACSPTSGATTSTRTRTSSTSACGGCGRSSARRRRSRRCGMAGIGSLRRKLGRARVGRVRRGEPGRDGARRRAGRRSRSTSSGSA